MTEERLSQEQLSARISEAENLVAAGGRYQHYKGNVYTVLYVALLEATNEPCVVYRAEYGACVTFIRPLNDWLAKVEVNGKTVPRFIEVDEA